MDVLYRGKWAALAALLVFTGGGCQLAMTEPGVARQLVRHQAMVDPAGLAAPQLLTAVKATCASPQHWTQLPVHKSLLYTHQHWKSPSGATGIGVVYVRMPLPFAAKTVAHFAKNEYAKRGAGGKILTEGFDQFGRYWFEGENDGYHARGYVITHGFDAWVIYSGYRRDAPLHPLEQRLAAKCVETVLPTGVENAAEMARVKPLYPRATASAE